MKGVAAVYAPVWVPFRAWVRRGRVAVFPSWAVAGTVAAVAVPAGAAAGFLIGWAEYGSTVSRFVGPTTDVSVAGLCGVAPGLASVPGCGRWYVDSTVSWGDAVRVGVGGGVYVAVLVAVGVAVALASSRRRVRRIE